MTDSTVQTTETGDVTVNAKNDGVTKAIIDANVNPTSNEMRSFGLGVALNVVGYDVKNVVTKAVESLIGDSTLLGAKNTAGTIAYVTDSTVNAAGSLSIVAKNTAEVDANLSNKSSTTGSSSSTTRGVHRSDPFL